MASLEERVKDHIDAGIREHARGRIDAAAQAYRHALALKPGHPRAAGLLGSVLLQLGDAESALSHLERALRVLRKDASLAGNLAQAYFATGRFAQACETFRKASLLEPRQGRFQLGIANSLAMQGRLVEAEDLLRRLADQYPNAYLILFNLGNVLRDRGLPSDAQAWYAKALAIEPGFIDARISLGSVLHSQFKFDEAEREYRACLESEPDHIPARLNLASLLIDIGDFAAAEEACRSIIELSPELALAHSWLGLALDHQGKLRQALDCYRCAAKLAPDDSETAGNYAESLANSGDLDAAFAEFSRALALKEDARLPRYARGTVCLANGQLADGWAGYAYRASFSRFCDARPEVRLARSLPQSLPDTTIDLLREQGLGDELFFLRFARELSAAGVPVTYHASGKLVSLLERAASVAVVEYDSEFPREHHSSTVMLLGDLPHAMSEYAAAKPPGFRFPSYPAPLELHPLDECLTAMRMRLATAGPPPYVAVSWRGGVPPRLQSGSRHWGLFKAIPIESLASAMRNVPASIIVLQREPEPGEIDAFARALGRPVHDGSKLNDDLEAMLALLALIEDYVGVSNTNMHLRAGVGKTARVLIPAPAEWRWMARGNTSPWFPGFTVYRQSDLGDWTAALETLTIDLRAALGSVT